VALLLRVALAWAADAGPAITDRLFDLRPAAWIVVRIGGPEALAEALLGHAATPTLLLSADPPAEDPFAQATVKAQVERLLCDDFEAEAQAAAATVLTALNEGRQPVALVALDRELVRRVRALLARAEVPLVDETGWLLATTRPAAALVALLRAASPQAGQDEQLDWLKTWPLAAQQQQRSLQVLEALWRGRRAAEGVEAAQQLLAEAQAHLQALRQPPQRSLAAWLAALQDRLVVSGQFDSLQDDAAGAQVLAALGWSEGAAWQAVAAELQLDLPGFTAWVQSTLEAQPFLPLPDPGAQVLLMPLSRAFGRPFAHVVVPGADAQRLGAAEPGATLINDALAVRLGLEHAASRRLQQRLALAHLLRGGRVSLLRRRRDGEEPLGESPEVEWLLLARSAHRDAAPWPLQDWQPPQRQVEPRPVQRPQPVAATALPATLSASRLEALRDCPYRFFSRAVLRLDEAEELEAALAKREYGTWLHAVLHRFHSQRVADLDGAEQLRQAADAATEELGLDPAELLPFRASFETFAPAYLAWLSTREAQGWRWLGGEVGLQVPLLDGAQTLLQLKGRIDRIDRKGDGSGGALDVLDYKTSSAQALKARVGEPLEDTQLPFYAALLGAPDGLSAAYVSLDDAKAPERIPHVDVGRTAQILLEKLRGEWQRLQQGAALPALGQGRVCDNCEARGLCRRDHWGSP
jgi:ATP-dependent helicase/nuclease subunit B